MRVTPVTPGHVIVVGATSTTVRLVEELERAGTDVVVVDTDPADTRWHADLAGFGAEVLLCEHLRAADLERAGIAEASAVVVLGQDDVVAIQWALMIEDLHPGVRLVLELANPRLGRRLEPLLGECMVLSSAALSAPAFVSAALASPEVQTFELAGRLVVAGARHRVGGDELAVLGNSHGGGTEPLLGREGDIVLGTRLVGEPDEQVRTSGWIGALGRVFDRRLRYVLVWLAALIVVSFVYFLALGKGWLVALYLALTQSTQTGVDMELEDLPLVWRIGAVVIQLFGLVLSSGITAVIVDALISARIDALTGGVRGKPRNHIVVCGLGRIGSSVITRLVARGVPVVAIELDEDSLGVRRARRMKVPVIIAEGTDQTALEQAGIARARGVLAVTDNDAANLEIVLAAREARSDIRVVARLFDHDLAERVRRRLGIETRSVSIVAGPAFAGAALARRNKQVVSVGRQVVLLTEVELPQAAGSGPWAWSDICKDDNTVLLARRSAGQDWHWYAGPSSGSDPAVDAPRRGGEVARRPEASGARLLQPGDEIAVAATRSGLAALTRWVAEYTE